ncbi:ROK family protein [Promicromonospora vindobonensis]|uniref:ROK family protein n=1 Tax=Promicromonospora vindobonensis TaxID=195748 RepID=A0ABW5W0U1_9MICO
MSRHSADVIVRSLVDDGWVEVIEPTGSVVGRPARRYRFHATVGHVMGVDVGGHKVLALITDLDGNVVASARHLVQPEDEPSIRLAAMDATIAECLETAAMTATDIWALTVGVTGPVDSTGRTSLFSPMPGWSGVDPIGHLSDRFSCPIQVENDCKLAAMAERWRGVAQDADDIVYVLAGMRTGAALIIEGKVRRGFGGAAGEIGWLLPVRWQRSVTHLESCGSLPSGIEPNEVLGWVLAACRDGDQEAQTAVKRYVKDLAVGAAALVLALDPQVVVLGGGVSRSADVILDQFNAELEKLSMRPPEVRVSIFGDESVALGAVRLGIDEVDAHSFGERLLQPVAPRRVAG